MVSRTAVAQPAEVATVSENVDADLKAIRDASAEVVAAFNAKDADKVGSLFMSNAALTDDAGNEYHGIEEIAAIFSRFFEQFPDSKMEFDIDSIRFAGPGVAIEEGLRHVTAEEGSEATNRYVMVHVKRDGKWVIASAREYAEDPELTAHECLAPLEWMVGDWVDEGADAAIAITCRWDRSENFLLVDFVAKVDGETALESRQRIGWDPLAHKVRSWVFDADGGYGEGRWTEVDGKWIVKSTAVLPDGTTGSATLFLEPISDDKFVMKGFDRVIGDSISEDFEAVVVRKPPHPAE